MRLTLPASIRNRLGIPKRTRLTLSLKNGKLMIEPLGKSYFESLAGILGTKGRMMKSLMEGKKRECEL